MDTDGVALEHAILVSLTELSGSGYELARRFDKSIGFFWSATHQQIYRVLRRMEEAGWLIGDTVSQEGKPDKRVFVVSPSGREKIGRWIAEPSDPSVLREELAVKIRGAQHGDIEALRSEVRRHRSVHDERLEKYRLIEKRDFPSPSNLDGSALHQYLVLRGGIRVEEGYAQWCDEVLEKL